MGIKAQFWSLTQTINHVFDRKSVRKTAMETGFSQRLSKLTPEIFLSLCTFLKDSVGNESLQHLCSAISYPYQTSISKQALHERFNKQAVSFLKEIYQQLVSNRVKIPLHVDVNRLFSRIRIMDSTSFNLEGDYPDYPGFRNSGVKIQFDYDWLHGDFLYQSVDPQTKNDKSAAREMMNSLLPGDLVLRDLGFYAATIMKEINKRGAYFITRAPSKTKFWVGSSKEGWTQIVPEEDLKDKDSGEVIDYGFVKVGGDARNSFIGRVVAQKLTPEQRKRRKQALKEKGQNGRHVQSALKRNDIQVLVTNITQEKLGPQDLYPLYTLRWQVEIIFKTWKSLYQINNVRKMKQERMECHLYGTLIKIILSSMAMFQCRYYLYQNHQKEISEYKAMDLIQGVLPYLGPALESGIKAIYELLLTVYENTTRHGIKDHRKGHQSPFDVLGLPYK